MNRLNRTPQALYESLSHDEQEFVKSYFPRVGKDGQFPVTPKNLVLAKFLTMRGLMYTFTGPFTLTARGESIRNWLDELANAEE